MLKILIKSNLIKIAQRNIKIFLIKVFKIRNSLMILKLIFITEIKEKWHSLFNKKYKFLAICLNFYWYIN